MLDGKLVLFGDKPFQFVLKIEARIAAEVIDHRITHVDKSEGLLPSAALGFRPHIEFHLSGSAQKRRYFRKFFMQSQLNALTRGLPPASPSD